MIATLKHVQTHTNTLFNYRNPGSDRMHNRGSDRHRIWFISVVKSPTHFVSIGGSDRNIKILKTTKCFGYGGSDRMMFSHSLDQHHGQVHN